MAADYGPAALVVLQYHVADGYATPETEARAREYEIPGFPVVTFDGNQNRVAGSTGDDYERYRAEVDEELALGSDLALAASWTAVTGTLYFSATVTNEGTAAMPGADLRFALYEDLGAGHRYVVRDLLPARRLPALDPGASVTMTATASFPTHVTLSQAGGVAFVQDVVFPELVVHQATRAVGPPILEVEPVRFILYVGPAASQPVTATITIENGGDGDLVWSAEAGAVWLGVSPAGGVAPAALLLSVDTAVLEMGAWARGSISIAAGEGTLDSPRVIGVDVYYGPVDRSYLPVVYR